MKAVNSLLVIAILLFATVMSWTYFAVKGDQPGINPQAGIGGGPGNNNSTSYQVTFRDLLAAHGNLAVAHLKNLYDGRSTADTSKKLEENATSLGNVIKQLGTAADQTNFLRAFRGHIEEYENYTQGLKDNKPEAMTTAKENLKMHAMDFGKLVHKLMPSLSEEKGTQLMNDHVNLTLAIIDAHAKGDKVKEMKEMTNANIQAQEFAGELAKGAEAANK